MSPLRIGIVGARFAADLHATNYRPLRPARAELTAVCSRTREEAERFARRHAIPRVFTDYHALAASTDVDVVDICTTTDMHHEIAVVAARAGKHVIVEKPLTGAFRDATEPRDAMLATALANADAVLDAVAKAGVTLCYGEDFVYAPPVAKLRRLLDASGGAILELRAEESHSGSHAAYARRWKSAGGGAFLRMGSHPVGAGLHLKHCVCARRRHLGRRIHHREGGDQGRLAVSEPRRGLDARLSPRIGRLRQRDQRTPRAAVGRAPGPRGGRDDLRGISLGSHRPPRRAATAMIPFAKGHGLGN